MHEVSINSSSLWLQSEKPAVRGQRPAVIVTIRPARLTHPEVT